MPCGFPTRFGLALLLALSCFGQSYQAPALVFTKTFGGSSGTDTAAAGAVDTHGNIITVGTTNSPDFPVVNAFRPTLQTLPLIQSPDGIAVSHANLGGAVDVLAMADSVNGAVVYAASDSGIFRSNDGGVTWAQQLPGIGGLNTIAVDAGDPNVLYGGISEYPFGGLLYRSNDGGKNWTALPTANGFSTFKNVETSAAPSTVYHMENALYRSRDRGNTWVALAPNKLYIFTYALAPSDEGVVYAVASDGLLYRSADGGDSWAATGAKFGAAGTQDPQVFSMGVDAQNENVVWMLAGANLYRSSDGGATAQVVLSIPQDMPRWVSVSRASGRLMVGGFYSALASVDGGATWQRFVSGFGTVFYFYANTVFASRNEFYLGVSSSTEIFLTKWSADGSTMVYSTFLGVGGSPVVATDANDNIWVTGLSYPGSPFATGTFNPQQGGWPFLAKFDPNGNLLFSEPVGGSRLVVDSAGYLYLLTSNNATQTGPDHCSPDSPNPVVMKLDPQGRVVYSRIVAEACGSYAYGLAVDSSGAVYLSGNTNSSQLSTTPTAIQPTPPTGYFSTGFLARLAPAGDRVTYLTYLGGDNTSAFGVAVDAAGRVYVTGGTNGYPPPTQPPTLGAYVIAIDPSNPTPLWLNAIGSGEGATLAIQSNGDIFVGGQTFSSEFPTLAPIQVQGTDVGFVSELSPDGKQLLFSSYASGNLVSGPQNVIAIVGRRTPSPHKLNANPPLGTYATYALVEKLDISATRPAVIDSIGNVQPLMYDYHPLLVGIAPGQLVRITGRGLGPSTTVGAQIDATGRVATSLAGTRVLFDGVPAPLISVQASEILCMTPFEVGGESLTSVQIERNGVAAPAVLAGVVSAALQVDVLSVANQDGSANSSANPAHHQQAVTLYITGAGDTVPSVPTGSIYQAPLPGPPPPNYIDCFILGGGMCGIDYVGPAPGMVAGIWQVNVRLPELNQTQFTNPITVSIGQFGAIGPYTSSAQATVWVSQ